MNDPFFMMIQQDTGNGVKTRLATNLRRLRIARHLSQSELARVTSMSKATLSGIEKGHGNPTVDTLASLASALGTSIAELLEEPQMGEVRIVRASQSPPAPTNAAGVRQLETSLEAHGRVNVLELALPANHAEAMPPRAGGSRQGLLVLAGTLVAGPTERISELTAGDYISFPADVPHVYQAGRSAVRLLAVAYTPS
jgi:transcriptional regulator with XRE-family HTH domain